MKRLLLTSLILISMTIFGNTAFARSSETKGAGEKHSGNAKVQLFNGKNLDGWYTFIKGKGRDNDPNKVFTVQKGLLTFSGEEFGCIPPTTNTKTINSLWSSNGEKPLLRPEQTKRGTANYYTHNLSLLLILKLSI